MVDTSVELNQQERKILDLGAQRQFSTGEALEMTGLVLEFPAEQAASAEENTRALVRRGLLLSGGSPHDQTLSLSALGLMNSSSAGATAALAERLLRYVQGRMHLCMRTFWLRSSWLLSRRTKLPNVGAR